MWMYGKSQFATIFLFWCNELKLLLLTGKFLFKISDLKYKTPSLFGSKLLLSYLKNYFLTLQKAVIEQKDYHFLTGTLSEVAKNRYCVEILGAARPEKPSRKKVPPPSPSSIAPISDVSATIPEEETSEATSHPPPFEASTSVPSSSLPPAPSSAEPSVEIPEEDKESHKKEAGVEHNMKDEEGDDESNDDEYARNAKQVKQQKKKANRKRKNRV